VSLAAADKWLEMSGCRRRLWVEGCRRRDYDGITAGVAQMAAALRESAASGKKRKWRQSPKSTVSAERRRSIACSTW